nr:hypothetical protein [Acidobacteriota bacterium]
MDTGGGMTVFAPELAGKAGCALGGPLTGFRMSGERIDALRCEGATVSFDRRTSRPHTVMVLDINHLLPPDWPRLDGLLSLATFDGHVVTIDRPGRRFVVGDGVPPDARSVRARFERSVTGPSLVAFVASRHDTTDVWLEVDTGSEGAVIINEAHTPRVGVAGPVTTAAFRSAPILRAACPRRGSATRRADASRGTPVLPCRRLRLRRPARRAASVRLAEIQGVRRSVGQEEHEPTGGRPSGVSPRRRSRSVALLALAAWFAPPASAGTISLRWPALDDPAVQGYAVYYGRDEAAMSGRFDAGLATEATLEGLDDCTTWFLTVRAYDADGNESPEPSNLIRGWPRPVVTAVEPRSILPGASALLTVTGSNFDPGDPADPAHPGAAIDLGHPGLEVLEVLRDACGQVRVRVEAAPDALPGASSLTVRNFDLSSPDPAAPRWIFGTLEQAIEVLAPPSGPTAAILESRPSAGQPGVSVSTREVRVQFDRDLRPLAEALDTGALHRAFRVLEGKKSLPQAPGSPAFEDDGRTVVIRLRDPLRAGLRYATAVDLAGASLRAALARAGHPELAMRWAWSTLPGWRTVDALVSAEARSGATGAAQPLAIDTPAHGTPNPGVAPDAEFRLRFAEPVWGPSVSASTIRLLRGGRPVKGVESP